MELDVDVCRSVQAPAAALCGGLQHNTAAAAAAYLQQHLLTYNPATVATSALPFAAIKQTASAFTAPLGKRHIKRNDGLPSAICYCIFKRTNNRKRGLAYCSPLIHLVKEFTT
jgi:hypothetical protein